MHRALSLPEIVSHIIAHVDSKGTLAILARTSSVVSDCALDELWYTVDSAILLARCMPPDVWDEVESFKPYQTGPGAEPGNGPRGEYSSQLAFTDHPRERDWLGERFRSYARRVRHLSIRDRVVDRKKWPIRRSSSMPDLNPNLESSVTVTHLYDYKVTSSLHPDVLAAWSSYSESVTAVFPNLSHIHWTVKDHADSQVALNLRIPSLRGLILSGTMFRRNHDWATTQVWAALDILRSAMNAAPWLEELVMFGEFPGLYYYDLSPMAALSWHSLQCLRTFRCVEKLPSSIVRHIATIPGLHYFTGYPAADTSFQNLSRVFPAVLELEVSGMSLGHLSDMMTAVQSPSIITLDFALATSGQLDARQVGDLLRIIEGHPSSQSLHKLVINSLSFSSLEEMMQLGTNLALGDIRPPLGIRHLRHIDLGCFTVAGDVADGFALALLHAWPELEELHLGPRSQTHISLSDFVEALRTRPALRVVPFKVVVQPGDIVPKTHGFTHHNLKDMRLDLGPLTTIHDRAVVVQFLNATFPNLEQYGVSCSDRSVRDLIWAGRNARLAGRPWALDEYETYLLQVSDDTVTV